MRITTIMLTASLMFAAPFAYADKDLKLEELPQAARETVEREVKTGKITEIDPDEHRGRKYFEVEFVENNQRFEIHVAEDGKLLQRKKD